MRKILIGGLGVAGLLATVLALASSPATSQTVVVFQTSTEPGTYTVSWSTEGGCDPSRPNADTTLATDGATGSQTATVAPGQTALPTDSVSDTVRTAERAGTAVEFSVSTAGHCNYNWTGTFTSNLGGSDGIRCLVGITGGTTATASGALGDPSGTATNVLEVTSTAGSCNTVANIHVDVLRPTTTDDGETVPDQPHSGAILNTEFTVGAQQASHRGYTPNDECLTVSEQTEVDDGADPVGTDDDTVGAILTVVRRPLSSTGAECAYDVGVVVPAGFEPRMRNSEGTRITSYTNFDPASAADATGEATAAMEAADCGETRYVSDTGEGDATTAANNTVAVTVRCNVADVEADLVVAERSIYILQNVVGDSGDANARYSLSGNADCAIPHDLPANLEGRNVGGIQTTDSVTVVELREGFFNISAAVMGRDSTDVDDAGRTFAPRYALNKDGEACSFDSTVSHLPGNCDAAEDSITVNAVTGADSNGRVIVTFDIGCSADDPADDAADGMDDMDDGMDDMDDGADDMDDMDDSDAMGPPADVATG